MYATLGEIRLKNVMILTMGPSMMSRSIEVDQTFDNQIREILVGEGGGGSPK